MRYRMEDSLKLKISHLFNSMRCFRAAYLQQTPSPPAPLTSPTNPTAQPRSATHKTPVLPSRIAEAFPSRRKCACLASSIAAHGNTREIRQSAVSVSWSVACVDRRAKQSFHEAGGFGATYHVFRSARALLLCRAVRGLIRMVA